MKNKKYYLIGFLFCLVGQLDAQLLTVNGGWQLDVPAGTVAGQNIFTLESLANQIVIFRINVNPNQSWDLSIRREDLDWNGNTSRVQIKRVNSGTGVGSTTLVGGTSYRNINPTNALFFSGVDDVRNINLQLRMNRLTVLTAANELFQTNLVFTLTVTSL